MPVKALADIDELALDLSGAHVTDAPDRDICDVHGYGPISMASNFFLASLTLSCSFTISTWMS